MTVYYVRPSSGSNAAAGTSFATAWQTTQYAFDHVAAGDEIRLCAEAVESVGTQIDWDTVAGTAASPILVTGASGTDGSVDGSRYTLQASAAITAIMDPSATTYWRHVRVHNVIFDGNSNATYCVSDTNFAAGVAQQCQYFYNCQFKNATTDGIRWRNGGGIELVNCEVNNNGSRGIFGFFSAGPGFLVNCYIHDNGSHGWYPTGISFPQVINCIFDSNGGSGMLVEMASTGRQLIVGNVFYGNAADGLKFATNTPNGGVIANNVFMSNLYGINWNSLSKGALFCDFNCYYNNTTNPTSDGATAPGTNNVTSNPSFTNAAGGDFTLGSSSPLILAGLAGSNIGAKGGPTPSASGGPPPHILTPLNGGAFPIY